jgi:hypothetical protein
MRLTLEKDYITVQHHSRVIGIRCCVRYSQNPKLPMFAYLEKTADGSSVDMVSRMLSETLEVLRLGFGDSASHCACAPRRPTCANIALQTTGLCPCCTVALMASDALPSIPSASLTSGLLFDAVKATSSGVTFRKSYNAVGQDGNLIEEQRLELATFNVHGISEKLVQKRLDQLVLTVSVQRFEKDGDRQKAVGIRGNNKSREQASSILDASSYKPSCRPITLFRSVCTRETLDTNLAGAIDACYRLRHYGFCSCLREDGIAEYGRLSIPSTGTCWKCSLRQFLNE